MSTATKPTTTKPAAPVTKRPKPIPGVEIREQKQREGGVCFRFRVRFTNAMGERDHAPAPVHRTLW
ncbi:MAG: hypothetical protein H0X28_00880 [Solirubrobacterales bacterium]|nr:hypothetical protein [Solirubrobacterales bacterium]